MDPLEQRTLKVTAGGPGDAPSHPAVVAELPVGAVVGDGRYQILAILGRGAMGCVYEVEQTFMKKRFAMKVLLVNQVADSEMRRFQKEAQTASRLDHPNLVHAVDFGMLWGCQPYLVMDLVIGTTLADYVRINGPMPFEEAIKLFIPVCLALDYAHREGVVHRDLKPTNIILERTADPSQYIPKVVDFGIAKVNLIEETALTRVGEVLGTPLYMSPEQCAGEAVDFKSDIYSLGCVIFECLTGTPPFVGQTALVTMMMHREETPPSMKQASMGKEFPRALETIMSKMMAKSPYDRYSSCMAIAQDFEYLKRGETQKVEAISSSRSSPGTSSKPIGRTSTEGNRLAIIIGSIVLLVILGTAAVLFLLFKSSDAQDREKSANAGTNSSPFSVGSPTSPADSEGKRHASLDGYVEGLKFADVVEGGFCHVIANERIYEFPTNDAIGTLYWWTKSATTPGEHLATGLFRTPVDTKAIFELGWNIIDHHATYMTGFSDDFLYGAIVNIRADWQSWGNDDALARALKFLENQSRSVRILELKAVQTNGFAFTKAQLGSLNKLDRVQWLLTKNSAISGPELVNLSFLPRLKALSMRQTKDCGVVLDKLSSDKNLQRLSLFDCALKTEELKFLSRLKKLRMLELRSIHHEDKSENGRVEMHKQIANLPELEQLTIDLADVMIPDAVQYISRLRKLKKISVVAPE